MLSIVDSTPTAAAATGTLGVHDPRSDSGAAGVAVRRLLEAFADGAPYRYAQTVPSPW